jgi:FtsP/CotA-like multicopper oxidase with cupredoxin domain
MTRSPLEGVKLSRRAFLGTSIAAGAVLAACGRSAPRPAPANNSMATAIASTEAARPHTGRTVTATLTPQPTTIDLGGTTARTLAYGSAIPGPLIRANVGDEVAVTVTNRA